MSADKDTLIKQLEEEIAKHKARIKELEKLVESLLWARSKL